MLTWDNFEFVSHTDSTHLPRFSVDDILCDGCTLETSIERVSKLYLATLTYMTYLAVNQNKRYHSSYNTEHSGKTVWDKPCKSNNLPLYKSKLMCNPYAFRLAEGATIKVVSALQEDDDEGFENYKGRFWYRVIGNRVEYVLSALISKDTDQTKLGKV